MHYSLLNYFQSNLGNVLNTEDAVKHAFALMCQNSCQTAVINHIIFSECIFVSPLSCVMCPHLMLPYLVCFLSLFNVIIS